MSEREKYPYLTDEDWLHHHAGGVREILVSASELNRLRGIERNHKASRVAAIIEDFADETRKHGGRYTIDHWGRTEDNKPIIIIHDNATGENGLLFVLTEDE